MRCPFCGHSDTAVKDSRTTEDQGSIRRRRFCQACGSRFTTYERIQLRDLTVLKKDGTRLPFDREKFAHSIRTALHKRSVNPERLEQMINGIIRRLETNGEYEVSTRTIGEMAMQALVNVDAVAYVRFASVYREFTDVKDFIDFISQMNEAAKNAIP